MSGIAAMRIQVSVLGTFQAMVVLVTGVEVIIKTPSECCANTGDLLEVSGPGSQDSLQACEMAQQGAPLRGSHPRYRLKDGFIVAARAPAAVAADGKSMGFVADALDETRGGRMRLEREWRGSAIYKESLLTRPAFRALGDPDQCHILETKRCEHRVPFIDLSETAIDKQQIRRWIFPVADAGVATRERLAQRRVVISRRDACD